MKSSVKLIELCEKFEKNIIKRSSEARKKRNLPIESIEIPDYRKLVMTKKFSNYSRCTCDHSKSDKCGKHKTKNLKKLNISKADSSSNSSSSSSSSSGSSSRSSSSSIRSSSSSSDSSGSNSSYSSKKSSSNCSSKSSKARKDNDRQKDKKKSEAFDDIKSMEINRKQNHPERLHTELSFNEPDQVRISFLPNNCLNKLKKWYLRGINKLES